MNRAGLSLLVLLVALAGGCSGDEAAAPPTSPTPPPPVATPPPSPPPSSSCVPGTPANLRVDVAGSTRTFSWNPSANAVDYFVQIGSASGASDLINTNTSQTTFVWTGNGPGTYYARVHARNTCGSSGNSNEVVFN